MYGLDAMFEFLEGPQNIQPQHEQVCKVFHCERCEVLWKSNRDFDKCWLCGVQVENVGKNIIVVNDWV